MTPVPGTFVNVRLPASQHPVMPQSTGTISAVQSDGLAVVFVYPSETVPNVSVPLPHKSKATATSGWWDVPRKEKK